MKQFTGNITRIDDTAFTRIGDTESISNRKIVTITSDDGAFIVSFWTNDVDLEVGDTVRLGVAFLGERPISEPADV